MQWGRTISLRQWDLNSEPQGGQTLLKKQPILSCGSGPASSIYISGHSARVCGSTRLHPFPASVFVCLQKSPGTLPTKCCIMHKAAGCASDVSIPTTCSFKSNSIFCLFWNRASETRPVPPPEQVTDEGIYPNCTFREANSTLANAVNLSKCCE